jgi:hypothetical protein
MSFEVIVSEYKDFQELKTFAASQYKVITELSKKIQKLEEEKKHLEELLVQTNPLNLTSSLPFNQSNKLSTDINVDFSASDSEIIARTQLRMLRDTAITTELTLEEAKKVELYNSILISLSKLINNENEIKIEKIDAKELLKALESNESNS